MSFVFTLLFFFFFSFYVLSASSRATLIFALPIYAMESHFRMNFIWSNYTITLHWSAFRVKFYCKLPIGIIGLLSIEFKLHMKWNKWNKNPFQQLLLLFKLFVHKSCQNHNVNSYCSKKIAWRFRLNIFLSENLH